MVRKAFFLSLACLGTLWADTGFKNTIHLTETDNSPACQVGQVKVTAGTLTCSGQTATISTGGSGGGIVSPGTFTWTNTNGISGSSLTATTALISTNTVSQIMYVNSDGAIVGNSSFTYVLNDPTFGGPTLKMEKSSAGTAMVFGSSNAMSANFYDGYHTYTNSHLFGSIVEHPNNYPNIAQGNMNLYQRDGGNFQLDVTGSGTQNFGEVQMRVASSTQEGTPHVVMAVTSTRCVVITDITNNVDARSGKRVIDCDPSAVLESSSVTKGFLVPRMTTTERDAISSPANGLLVYNTTLSTFSYYNGSAWTTLGGGGGAGGTAGGTQGQIQYNNSLAFAGAANTFVTASSATFSESVKISSITVSTFSATVTPNTLLELDRVIPDSNAPSGIQGAGATDPHSVLFFADSSQKILRKMGMQWTALKILPGTAYSYGGLFGKMTSDNGYTVGRLSFDMRQKPTDTSLSEVFLIDQGSVTVNGPEGLVVTYGITASTITSDVLITSPTASGKATGNKAILASADNITFGTAVHFGSDKSVHIATATSLSNASAVAVCADATCTSGSNNNYLLEGEMTTTTATWTVGGLVYLSLTGTDQNTLTQTAPSGSTQVVQVLGVAIDSNRILFKPQLAQTVNP